MSVAQEEITMWGLGSRDLHEAWWRCKGVTCVRRGNQLAVARDAELYMLLEDDQLLVFELREVISQIAWNPAVPVRVRVIERSHEAYREQVVLDEAGDVIGIRRAYSPDEKTAYRVILTTNRRVAAVWSGARNRREALHTIRGITSSRASNSRVTGHCFDAKLADDATKFIERLVAEWDDPSRSIDGIKKIGEGIFVSASFERAESAKFVGPVWIGHRADLPKVVVGPTLFLDHEPVEGGEVLVRDIQDVMPTSVASSLRVLPRRSFYGVAKRIFDCLVAMIALILLSPVLLLVAVAVAIDDGFPVLFGHVRQRRGGEDFKCWKFRTMRRDAEAMVEELRAMNQADGPQVFIENDPRVTRVGRFLRASQLDELPQLFNVFLGQMSIVGPRPSPDRENQICPAWREMRLSVRPGITGLWQVRRTREDGLDFQEWVRFDLEYIRSACFSLDCRIILETIRVSLFRQRSR